MNLLNVVNFKAVKCVDGCLSSSTAKNDSKSNSVDEMPRLLSRDDFPNDHKRHRRYNEALRRPMSSCLKNYEFNMNMAASIVHRATGTAVASLLYGTMATYAVVDIPFCEMMSGFEDVSPAAVATGKMATVWGFAYHILAGFRHLVNPPKKIFSTCLFVLLTY